MVSPERAPDVVRASRLLRGTALVVLGALLLGAPVLVAQRSEGDGPNGLPGLVPTAHPPVPTVLRDLWLVPGSSSDSGTAASTPLANLQRAARLAASGQHRDAVLLIDPEALGSSPLVPYARFLLASSLATLERHAEALKAYLALGAMKPEGALSREWRRGAAKSAEVLGDHVLAAAQYEALVTDPSARSAEALDGWGRALTVLGQRERAVAAYVRLDRDFPASEFAAHARAQTEALVALTGQVVPRVFAEELARAERLVAARAYGDARLALERVVAITDAADRPMVDLRLASVNLTQKRYAKVLELAAPHRAQGEKQDEAGYLWAVAARRLGRVGDFVPEVRRLATAYPDSRWSERALDELALHYIVQDSDDEAAEVYRQIITQFPKGATAERAYWRYGWRQYRAGQLATAAQVFDQGASSFPRSDYRPAYLYWAGRAHAQVGAVDVARARLSVAVSDYGNSYYGRLATEWKTRLDAQSRHAAPTIRLASAAVGAQQATPIAPPAASQPDVPPMPEAPRGGADVPDTTAIPTDAIVRQLIALEFYDAALLELEYAKVKWGASASLDATIAWIYNRSGDLRRGINTMKRAYPQYMSDGGDALPVDVQRVLFPLQYWDIIRRYSTERGLDPFLVAALVAQESTFQADVRSSANAYGLMQIIPSTGRLLARLEGVKGFTTRSLINPDLNVRLGTAYFKRLIDRFEHPHLALAGYNAGDSRVVRWTAERSALPADEFVEDIPFPETQNYVKRILGTASDYRRVYGALALAPLPNSRVDAAASSSTGPAGAPASVGTAIAKEPAAVKKPAAARKPAAQKPASRKPATRKAVPKKPATKAVAKKAATPRDSMSAGSESSGRRPSSADTPGRSGVPASRRVVARAPRPRAPHRAAAAP